MKNEDTEEKPNRTYLTVQQTAARLAVSEATVRAWAKRYGLPVIKIGPQTTRVSVDDLDKWIADRGRRIRASGS